MNKNQMQNTS